MTRPSLHVGALAALLLVTLTGALLAVGAVRVIQDFSSFPTVPSALFEYAPDCLAPSQQLVATPFVLSGGGAAGFVDYFVSVRPVGERLDPIGAIPLVGRPPARIRWHDSLTLVIRAARSAKPDSTYVVAGTGARVALRWESGEAADSTVSYCATAPLVNAGTREFPCGIGRRCRQPASSGS
jgi:hypothetical protein